MNLNSEIKENGQFKVLGKKALEPLILLIRMQNKADTLENTWIVL